MSLSKINYFPVHIALQTCKLSCFSFSIYQHAYCMKHFVFTQASKTVAKQQVSVRAQTRCQVLVKCFSPSDWLSCVISWNFFVAATVYTSPYPWTTRYDLKQTNTNTQTKQNNWSTIYSNCLHWGKCDFSAAKLMFWPLNGPILLMHKSSEIPTACWWVIYNASLWYKYGMAIIRHLIIKSLSQKIPEFSC